MLVTKQPNEKFFLIETDSSELMVMSELALLFQLSTEDVVKGMFKFSEHMAVGKILNRIAEVSEFKNESE